MSPGEEKPLLAGGVARLSSSDRQTVSKGKKPEWKEREARIPLVLSLWAVC